MALRDLLNEFKENALATARGIGTGASAGFIKYPSASLMVLVDQVMAENPQLTFKQALGLINEQQQRDREERPVAAYGGELAGALVPGVGMVRAGASLPGAIGAGAALGGAGAYNENQDPNAILPGMAFGAAGGGAGRVLQVGQEKAVRFAVGRVGAQRADEAAQAISVKNDEIARIQARAAQTGKLTSTDKKALDKANRSIRTLNTSKEKGEEMQLAARVMPTEDLMYYARPGFKGKENKFSLGILAGSGVGDVLGTTRASIANSGVNTMNNAIFGAGAGAGLSHLLGGDPILGAMLGGGTGRFLGPALKGKAAALSAIPYQTAPAAAAMAVPFASRGVAEAAKVAEPVEDFSDLVEEDDFSDLTEE